MINVYDVPAKSPAKVIQIPNTLTAYQAAVGGYIEVVRIPGLKENGILMICNEEGILNGLPLNENLLPFFFVGDVFFCTEKGDRIAGLSDDQIAYLHGWLEGLNER